MVCMKEGYFMKSTKKLVMLFSIIFMMLGEVSVASTAFDSSENTVLATTYKRRHHKRHVRRHSKAKIWTGDYKIVGNKRSKIFHVIHGHSYRMNRENAVFFKSKAAARAVGYRESKR